MKCDVTVGPAATSKIEFIERLFLVMASADCRDELFWWGKAASFHINCNDTFYWGCADAEPVTWENLPLLEQTYLDLKALDSQPIENLRKGAEGSFSDGLTLPADFWLSLVFCARSRGMRPQGAVYPKGATAICEMLNAAGPDRDIDFCNPKNQQHEYKYAPIVEG